ncbi:type II toxin-antitoxin system HicB family antitoxin [Cohnella panacarvi]|uniref:type II toxin-antitoxin system HicB family antitoxin n=1 Tax=Cohnella panacarvi TaxID=400776 RepID=UPI00047C5ABB|nr:type II toxin-antitoxin system HicB family antitoxin [Cohnella panacarvi]
MTQISFPAVFSYDTDGITIEFPDLPGCISCGFTREEAIAMSKEALSLYLSDWDEKSIPRPTDPKKVTVDNKNQEIVVIEILI